MKYKGESVKGGNEEIIPFPRPTGDIVFVARSVKDWSEFDNLVERPKVPTRIKPGGMVIELPKDPAYIEAVENYATLKTDFLYIKSLESTEDLEWETIDLKIPSTWKNFYKELEDSDFTPQEIVRLTVGIMCANSLDDAMINEARNAFLLRRQEVKKST